MRFSTACRNRFSMLIVISQSASACHMESGDDVSSSLGKLFADSCLLRSVFAALAFSTQAWDALCILSSTTHSAFFVCCRVVTCWTSGRIYGGFFALAMWTLNCVMSEFLAYEIIDTRLTHLSLSFPQLLLAYPGFDEASCYSVVVAAVLDVSPNAAHLPNFRRNDVGPYTAYYAHLVVVH